MWGTIYRKILKKSRIEWWMLRLSKWGVLIESKKNDWKKMVFLII